MITKNDWDAALDSWVAAERERLGGPPAPEEVVAYTRGELAATDAARVRALLVYYPELTPLLTDTTRPKRRALPRFVQIAALLVLGIAIGAIVQSQRERDPEPYAHQTRHELQAFRARGGPATPPVHVLPPHEEQYLLALVLFDMPSYGTYRIDIVDISGREPETVWTTKTAPKEHGTFNITVPRKFIHPGTRRIDVYGVENSRVRRLESFRVRVGDDG